MKIVYPLLFLLILCTTSWSCSDSDETTIAASTPDDIEITDESSTNSEALTLTDVTYGPDPAQVYDLYLPANRGATKTKVIILIHGGGWTEGDKDDVTSFINLVQSEHPNHAVVNMNYVLASPPAIPAFPNQFLDVQAVINHLNMTREELGFLNEYGFIGISAGAHLAMMYDYVYDDEDLVKFVANIVGPADFTDPFYADELGFDIYIDALTDESAYPENTNYSEVLSPAVVVSASSSPTLQFYGDTDPLVPLTNGQRLDTALSNFGIPHLFTIYEGGHGDWNPESFLDLQQKVGSYIDLYLPIE